MPTPVSLTGEHHEISRRDVLVPVEIGAVDKHVVGFNRQLAASRHRVACVDDEVDQHLHHLHRIDADLPQVGARQRGQLDVFVDQPDQHAARVGDQLVQIDHARLDDLLTREGQELTREVRGLRRGRFDVLEVRRAAARTAEAQQFQRSENDGQQVVEIVRDTAGEAADGFHLLRLEQLLLEILQIGSVMADGGAPARGDIASGDDHVFAAAVSSGMRLGLRGDPLVASVRLTDARVRVEPPAIVRDGKQARRDGLPLVGVREIQQRVRRIGKIRRIAAEHPAHVTRKGDAPDGPVTVADAHLRRVDGGTG